MILRITGLLSVILIPLFSFSQSKYELSMQHYRDSIDAEFADSATSILTEEDRLNFHGLNYFDIDENYKVNVKFKKKIFRRAFEMPTSTDRLPIYKPYGTITFIIDGKEVTLTVYENVGLSKKKEYENYLFCPFKDATCPKESYGGGRYLDVDKRDLKNNPIIDFNKSYNPYCAYNDRYSCPIPPKENRLNIEIKAGVKKWH